MLLFKTHIGRKLMLAKAVELHKSVFHIAKDKWLPNALDLCPTLDHSQFVEWLTPN